MPMFGKRLGAPRVATMHKYSIATCKNRIRGLFDGHRRLARSLIVFGGVALAGLFVFAVWDVYLLLSGNFHTVVAGELYRSAQPSAGEIVKYENRYGIKTIINLRGPRAGQPWYDKEVSTARRLGVAHIDFEMSASKVLTQAEATRLLALFKGVQRPILIHCRAGADRSGIAAALYVAAIAKRGEETAESQLSVRYGHVGIPYLSSSYALDTAWEALEPWLNFPHS